jgi:hypothetical protein
MSLTCVSCYFHVTNKHGNKYFEWFKNTLSINCPYVFYTTKENIEFIKEFRKDLPTYYIVCEIKDFYTFKYKDNMITHPIHCPSIELNLIWNEKIFMLQNASKLNPFNSEWFKWMDSGICIYRDVKPPDAIFPNVNKLKDIPKNKFIYSSSNPFIQNMVSVKNYYHHISGTYLMHKEFIDYFTNIYAFYLEKLVDKNNIWTDQVILTHIYNDHPHFFHKLCDGYGSITAFLY